MSDLLGSAELILLPLIPSDIPTDYPPWDILIQKIVGDQLRNLCVIKVV